MKYRNLSVSMCAFLLLMACQVIKPKDGYEKLPEGWKDIVVPLTTFDQAKRSEITKINGGQLKEELKKHPKSIVNLVVNHCPSNGDLKHLEDYSKKNGYKLFVVMYDFSMPYRIFNQEVTEPIYAIDTPHYKTENTNKSAKFFTNEMLDKRADEKVEYVSYYVFDQGVYVPNASELITKELESIQN